ncbi:MAG: hypothetical protein JWO36_1175, partial [Myxococcales bacterium]|nr:hypothetical protein [Myxococcales bacterium]
HGAAVIDRSPASPAPVETAQLLQKGIEAYDELKFDEAVAALDQARDLADRTGAAGLTKTQLSDLFLYRGLVKAQQTDATAAWDELITASVVDPTRDLDPARFPPKVGVELARAHEQVIHQRSAASLAVDAPAGCSVTVDGTAQTGEVKHITGPHWVRAVCPDYAPWGVRIDLTSLGARVLATPTLYAAPVESDLLVQARVSGARSLVIAEVHGDVATARLLTLDGRERDRRTVTIKGDLSPLAEAINTLLIPTPPQHWYQKRWAWAAGAATLAAIVLVPITAVIARDRSATDLSVRPVWPTGVTPL